MENKKFFFIAIFSFLFFTACFQKKNIEDYDFNNDGYFHIDMSANSSNINIMKDSIILEGVYGNECVGRKAGSLWRIYSKAQVHSLGLVVKKNDFKCKIAVTKVTIYSASKVDQYLLNNEKTEKYFLTDSFSDEMLVFRRFDRSKIELGDVLYVKVKLSNSDFSSLPKIQLVLSNIDDSSIELVNAKEGVLELSLSSLNSYKAQGELSSNVFKKIKIENVGTFPILIKSYSSSNIFNDNCSYPRFLLQKGESCSLDLMLNIKSISENNFNFSVDYLFENNSEILKNVNKNFTLKGIFEEEFLDIPDLKSKSIYKVFPLESSVYVATYNDSEGGLYYSEHFPELPFRRVVGITSNDIRNMAFAGGITYVATYGDANGGLYYSVNGHRGPFKRIVDVKQKDIRSVVAVGNIIYVATASDGLWYSKEGPEGKFQKVTGIHEKYINGLDVSNGKVYVTVEHKLYYSRDLTSGYFYKAPHYFNDNYIGDIEIVGNSIFIAGENGLYVSSSGVDGVFESKQEMIGNEVYSLASLGQTVYATVMCGSSSRLGSLRVVSKAKTLDQRCKKGGLYFANLKTDRKFEKMASMVNTLGVSVLGNMTYLATTHGLYYSGSQIKKSISQYNQNPEYDFKSLHLIENNIYVKNNGIDKGIFKLVEGENNIFQKTQNSFMNEYMQKFHVYKNFVYFLSQDSYANSSLWFSDTGIEGQFQNLKDFQNKNIVGFSQYENEVYITTPYEIMIFKNGIKKPYITLNARIPYFIKNVFSSDRFILLATDNGLYYALKNAENYQFKRVDSLPNLKINDLYISGKLILAATQNGIWYTHEDLDSTFRKVNTFGSGEILSLTMLGNSIYTITHSGIFKNYLSDYPNGFINKNKENTIDLRSQNLELTGLSDNTINYVYASENSIYAATQKGLSISRDAGKTFEHKILGQLFNPAYSIIQANGVLYVGTKNGLFRSFNNGQSFHLNSEAIKINSMVEKEGKFYIATENGLYKRNSALSSFELVTHDLLKDLQVYNFYADNSYFYSVTSKGTLLRSQDGVSFEIFKVFDTNLNNIFVTSVYASGKDIIIGTKSGLAISRDSGKRFSMKTKEKNDLVSNRITDIYCVGNSMYVGTEEGVSFSFDGGESFSNFTVENGLGSNKVNDVYVQVADVPGFSLATYVATENGLAISGVL